MGPHMPHFCEKTGKIINIVVCKYALTIIVFTPNKLFHDLLFTSVLMHMN